MIVDHNGAADGGWAILPGHNLLGAFRNGENLILIMDLLLL